MCHSADKQRAIICTRSFLLLHQQGTYAQIADPARQFATNINIYRLTAAGIQTNAAGIKRNAIVATQTTETKNFGILQEEITLLREKQIKTGQVDLPVIHFSSGKIGIQSQCTGQVWRKFIEHIQGWLDTAFRVVGNMIFCRGHDYRRHYVQTQPLLQASHADYLSAGRRINGATE